MTLRFLDDDDFLSGATGSASSSVSESMPRGVEGETGASSSCI